MSDILYECAKAFDDVLKYNYELDVSRYQRPLVIIMDCLESEITHIMGLDHLKDIPILKTNNANVKATAFHQILNSELTISDIQKSDFFNAPFLSTHNTATNAPYNLSERIMVLRDIEQILDSAHTGEFYKWDKNNAKIIMPDGRQRQTSINADYMLKVPSKTNPDENIYLFLYKEKSIVHSKNEPIKLHLFSAFADCIDLARGQERPFKILQETKINVKEETSEVLYKNPNFDPSIDVQRKIKLDISMLASQLSEKRIIFARNGTEENLRDYIELQDRFTALVDKSKLYEYAKGLLKKQKDKALLKAQKTGENDTVSYIDEDIQHVQEKQDIDDTAIRHLNFQINIGKDTPNFSIQDGALALDNAPAKTISFSLPYPPKKPFKAIHTKIKSLINSISNNFKPNHNSDTSSSSSSNPYAVQEQQEQEPIQNKVSITHNNPEKQILPNKTISFEYEDELVQNTPQTQTTEKPPKTIASDENETAIHTDTVPLKSDTAPQPENTFNASLNNPNKPSTPKPKPKKKQIEYGD